MSACKFGTYVASVIASVKQLLADNRSILKAISGLRHAVAEDKVIVLVYGTGRVAFDQV